MTAVWRAAPLLATAAVLAAGCATVDRRTARVDARQTLALSEPLRTDSQQLGQTTMGFGDAYTATNLFERSAAARGDPRARFNLAEGYERTGRLREAQQIYQTLIADGKFTRLQTVSPFADRQKRERWFIVAEEAQRRSAYLDAYLATQSASEATGAIAPIQEPAAHVSNDQAYLLDGEASRDPFPTTGAPGTFKPR